MEKWITTTDTRLAAAFGTLGVPIKLRSTLIERTGKRVTRFYLGRTSADGLVTTGILRRDYLAGKIEKSDPAHPFLTIMRTYQNRDALLDLQNQGRFCRLVPVPDAPGIHQYIPSCEGLPGVTGHPMLIETGDLKLVAALGTCGFPLLSLTGTRGNHLYHLPAKIPGSDLDAVQLMNDWRRDKASIPWEHPFAQAARGLHNRERLLDAVRRDMEIILIQKPRSTRAATIRPDASPRGWDQIKSHFDA